MGCSSEAKLLQALFAALFNSRWCYRPEEMSEVRLDPFARNATIDLCVWGFKVPAAPRQCPVLAT